MYVSDHQKGDLSDIIRSANLTIQSETDHDRWKFPEGFRTSFQQIPANDFGTSCSIKDSLLHSGDQILVDQNMLSVGDESMRTPNDNIISRVFHLSSPVKQSELVLGQGDSISPPYIPGAKRRKSLPRKVVCIPAPGNTNTSSGRATSGEIVPCDLWAWRKYGQKPIKGSPYPRGYYRCSSSKGCAARKQVERSRTDPNMLVITYTSEHNHPWPTQRNALAGSTRSSYPSKHLKPSPSTNSKDTNKTSTTASNSGSTSITEEVSETMDSANEALYDTCMENDDLFANLAELENDPVSLLFEKSDVNKNGKNCKEVDDAFDDIFDWEQSSFVDHSSQ